MSDDHRPPNARISQVMRRLAPEQVEERVRRAIDDPALQAAVEEMQRERAASRPPAIEAEGDDERTVPRAGAPNPWAKDGATAIDKAALPSAGAPAAEPVEKTVAATRSERPANKLRAMWPIWAAAGTIAAVLVTLMLARSLRERGAAPTASAATTASPMVTASATATASAAATASAMAAASATTSLSAAPTSTTTPSGARPKARPKKNDDVEAPKPGPGEDIW